MLEYYEPYLNLSSPEHSNTMGVILSLHDPVDGEILRSVAEELRVRFPYFYVKVACRNNEVITVPNPLPMTVRNSWDSINFNSEDSNYHRWSRRSTIYKERDVFISFKSNWSKI